MRFQAPRRTWCDDSAATMPEYALMIALVALVCFAAVTLLGVNVSAVFSNGALTGAL